MKLPAHPVEKAFKQALSPLESFVHEEASSGILLMICAFSAIIIANTGLYATYKEILHTQVTLGGGSLSLSLSLHHWINDGLMALFFFVVGLEIKRELIVGELADRRQAILPLGAALGGMIVPALAYLFFNTHSPAIKGWGIPMATDIAFALGVLALLGKRIPPALVGFLLALAIIDDLGAVLVIAIFYTSDIHIGSLLTAGLFFCLLILCNLGGFRRPLPYILFGTLLWICMLKSGVHATLAGVLTALTVPANVFCDNALFVTKMQNLLDEFTHLAREDTHIMNNSLQQKRLQTMENYVHMMESPLQRMEHGLHIWVSFLIIPIFALANGGIPIDFFNLPTILAHPVTIGVGCGLILGKAFGVVSFSWLVLKLRLSTLPQDVSLSHIAGVGLLAGIGFTMSIFIAGLAFADQPELLLNAKIGIVAASLVSGFGGYFWLRRVTP